MEARTDDRDVIFSTQEAADYMRVRAATLRAWKMRGDGPPVLKAGRDNRYRKSELDAWLERSRPDETDTE